MSTLQYDFYIDETGSFEDRQLKAGYNPSAVGGLLCLRSKISEQQLINMVKEDYIHGCEAYNKDAYLGYLQQMKRRGGEFVMFENQERIFVIDCDVTYLNIITEGLVNLFNELRYQHPDDEIAIQVVIAKRTDVVLLKETNEQQKEWIVDKEWRNRLEEKLILAMGKANIEHVNYTLRFANAKRYKPLMMADIICNTYLKRTARGIFTEKDRELIRSLYDEKYIYSVFRNATVGYIKRLISEQRYSEAVYQLCTLPRLTKATGELCETVLQRIPMLKPGEQWHLFTAISGQMGVYNSRAMYSSGIAFAMNYLDYFLRKIEIDKLRKMIDYWIFDTEFYILTMYEHLGHTLKCAEYLDLCNRDIKNVTYSVENMAYRINFRVREMNILIGRFDFDGVLRKSRELQSMLDEIKLLMLMVEKTDSNDAPIQSEHLAKVYGVQMQTFNNLYQKDPTVMEQALAVSEKSVKEFSQKYDKGRQYQYRCTLYVSAGDARKAYECLMLSLGFDPADENANILFTEQVFRNPGRVDLYSLFHYTAVMELMQREKDPRAGKMFDALKKCGPFRDMVHGGADLNREYPMNMVWWNLSRYIRDSKADFYANESSLYGRAYNMTVQNADKITYGTFAIAMSAERLLWLRRTGGQLKEAEQQLDRAAAVLSREGVPQTMKDWFGPVSNAKVITDERLAELSRLYVR